MTIRARNRFVAVGVAMAVVVVVLLPILASSWGGGVRELRIITRDMTFYVDGNPEPNPTIVLRAGEKVKLVLRNEDAGMSHDFVVKSWTVATRLLEDRGEEDAVTFQVPEERGSTTYHCTPHAKMMSGTLRIE